MRPNTAPENCWFATPRCTTATIGLVHEARGQFREAVDCYRRVIEFTHADPENYDAGFVDSFLELIVKLEASAAEADRVVNDADPAG
jgi:hypothetical protein